MTLPKSPSGNGGLPVKQQETQSWVTVTLYYVQYLGYTQLVLGLHWLIQLLSAAATATARINIPCWHSYWPAQSVNVLSHIHGMNVSFLQVYY